jgi:hypothetical protein
MLVLTRRRLVTAAMAAVAGICLLYLWPASPPSGEMVFSGGRYGFNDVLALAADGPDIWVANAGGNSPSAGGDSLTELNAADGSWVRTLSGRRLGLDSPSWIAAYGNYLWVVNEPADGNWSLTEVNTVTGMSVRTVDASGANDFGGITVDGSDLWVAGGSGNADVTELNAVNGTLIRAITSPDLSNAYAIAAEGPDIWVANEENPLLNGSVTELDTDTGRAVWTIAGNSHAVPDPAVIYPDGPGRLGRQ